MHNFRISKRFGQNSPQENVTKQTICSFRLLRDIKTLYFKDSTPRSASGWQSVNFVTDHQPRS